MTASISREQLEDMIGPGQEDLALEALKEIEAPGSQPKEEAESDPTHPLDRYVDAVNAEADKDDPLAEFLSTGEEPKDQGDGDGDDDIPEEYRGKSLKEVIALAEAKAKQPAGPAALPPEAYTPELGKSLYGEALTSLFAAAEVNPLQLDATLRSGGDVSEAVEALATKAGLPKTVVETYLAGARQQAPSSKELTAEDGAELRQLVGGDEEFRRLSTWAAGNLSKEELTEYNAAVDSGDKAAVRWALRTLQARAGSATRPGGRTEAKPVVGGRPQSALRFTSQEAQDRAVDKRNSQGERLMLVDPAYAKRVQQAIANSPNFS
jgi:hypothetical protein